MFGFSIVVHLEITYANDIPRRLITLVISCDTLHLLLILIYDEIFR